MATTKRIEFANYTLKFGEKLVLLDLFDEVVMPCFEHRKYKKGIKDKSEFFFTDTKLMVLDSNPNEPVIGIAGRIVKNMMLKRDQYFEETTGKLIKSPDKLDSAPTSIFLLILNNHRLILCKEVPGAPTLDNFQSTCQSFLSKRHKEFLKELKEQNEKDIEAGLTKEKETNLSISLKYPSPHLRVTPLSGQQELNEFIDRFSHIESLVVRLLPTNREEADNDDFWASMEKTRDGMNSHTTSISFSNRGDGLDAAQVLVQSSAASLLGNSSLRFVGTDRLGDVLKGNNEDFKLAVEVDELPISPVEAAKQTYWKFTELVREGVITLSKNARSTIDKINILFNRIKE